MCKINLLEINRLKKIYKKSRRRRKKETEKNESLGEKKKPREGERERLKHNERLLIQLFRNSAGVFIEQRWSNNKSREAILVNRWKPIILYVHYWCQWCRPYGSDGRLTAGGDRGGGGFFFPPLTLFWFMNFFFFFGGGGGRGLSRKRTQRE